MKYSFKDVHCKCPVCSFNLGKLLFKVNSSESARLNVPKDKNKFKLLKDEIEYIWGSKECKVIKCPKCSFTYAFPHKEGTPKYYSLIYDNLQYPTWREEYNFVLEKIKKRFAESGAFKYLEIGAGNGIFAEKVGEIIGKENVVCLEYSKRSILEIKEKGLTCFDEDLKNFKSKDKFSVICFFSSLHHMDSPNSVFEKLSNLCVDFGDVFITTSSEENVLFMETKMDMLAFPPTYVGRWNLKSFDYMGSKYGFKIASHQLFYHSFFNTLKELSIGKYTKVSENPKNISHKVMGFKNVFLRRFFSMFFVLFYAFLLFPIVLRKRKIPYLHVTQLKKS